MNVGWSEVFKKQMTSFIKLSKSEIYNRVCAVSPVDNIGCNSIVHCGAPVCINKFKLYLSIDGHMVCTQSRSVSQSVRVRNSVQPSSLVSGGLADHIRTIERRLGFGRFGGHWEFSGKNTRCRCPRGVRFERPTCLQKGFKLNAGRDDEQRQGQPRLPTDVPHLRAGSSPGAVVQSAFLQPRLADGSPTC